MAWISLDNFFFESIRNTFWLNQCYREDLDRLAKEQRRSKLIDRIDQINSYPEHNLESWKDFDQAYQQNQQIHKQKIRDSLDENYRLYMDKKYKIVNLAKKKLVFIKSLETREGGFWFWDAQKIWGGKEIWRVGS